MTDWPEKIEDLYGNAPSGYLYTSPDGVITRANQTFLSWLGYSASDVEGKRLSELLPVSGQIFYETHILPTQQMQGYLNEVALDFVRRDGSLLPALVSVLQKRDAHDQPVFNRVTIFNATERRRYEQELVFARKEAQEKSVELARLNASLQDEVQRQIQERLHMERQLDRAERLEAIGRLAGGVAHDFNNLLFGISGLVQELSTDARIPSEAREDLLEVLRTTKRATALAGQLLAVGRQQPSKSERLNLNVAIRDSENLLRRLAGERCRLEFQLGQINPVRLDPIQFEQILTNLVVNARDAMAAGGQILVRTTEDVYRGDAGDADQAPVPPIALPSDKRYVVLEVRDTGTGIPKDLLSHIFEPFVTTKAVGKGTGLGLATVYGIVQQHSGHIQVQSRPGEGTCFRLFFPAIRSEMPAVTSVSDVR